MNTDRSLVECAECGLHLEHTPEEPEPRPACPQCGSTKRNYYVRATKAGPSNYLLDNFIAHKLSELNTCSAPELVEEAEWLNTFILKTVFHISLPRQTRAYLFSFLRRAEGASMAYREGRRLLLEQLSSPRNVITQYFRALTLFEICIAQCYQGYELLGRASGQTVFERGVGSSAEKLHTVYVDSKHMDGMIHGNKLPPQATSGVWITNEGIESSHGLIPFHELHDLLSRMHRLAETLCTMQPPEPPERLPHS